MTRNFPTRESNSGSSIVAEITGFVGVLRDTDGNPTGLPLQSSKKWDELETKKTYEARYHPPQNGRGNNWWTLNTFVRVPAGAQITLELAVAYNQYGGVPSFSHAQLSLIGYSYSWVWHETSLASMGENMCIDTAGSHRR